MTKQHDQTKTGTNKQHNQLKPASIDISVPKHCDPKACLSMIKRTKLKLCCIWSVECGFKSRLCPLKQDTEQLLCPVG